VLNRLRLNRWIAALLLIASPALGGQAAMVAHACPPTASADGSTTMAGMAGMPGMAHHAGQSHDTGQGAHHNCDCTCVTCCYTFTTTAPEIVAVTVAYTVAIAATPEVTAAVDHTTQYLARLPDTTAPPLA
jgi:hypothetical protein